LRYVFTLELYLNLESLLESATYLYGSYFGDPNKRFVGDTWAYNANDAITYTTFSRETCFPLMKMDYSLTLRRNLI